MNFYILQVAPSQMLNSLLVLLATGFIVELVVMQLMKWDSLIKSIIHSLLINLASVLLSALLFLAWQELAKRQEIELPSWWYVLVPMFVLIWIFEVVLLKWLKPAEKTGRIVVLSLLLNAGTAAVFYLFVNNFRQLTQSL